MDCTFDNFFNPRLFGTEFHLHKHALPKKNSKKLFGRVDLEKKSHFLVEFTSLHWITFCSFLISCDQVLYYFSLRSFPTLCRFSFRWFASILSYQSCIIYRFVQKIGNIVLQGQLLFNCSYIFTTFFLFLEFVLAHSL